MSNSEFDLDYFILMIILRRGGEWPDWGNPFGQIFLGAAIARMAEHVNDEQVRLQINKIVGGMVSGQGARMFEK